MKDYVKQAMKSQAPQLRIVNRFSQDEDFGLSRMQLLNGIVGLTDEVGELAGAIKKFTEYGQPLDKTNLKEEVGDAFWRLAQICDAVGLTFEECMEANLSKLQGKKGRYEKGYSEEAAKEENRDRAAERKILESNKEPWKNANSNGELPGDICCQRATGKYCYEHDPSNYRISANGWDLKPHDYQRSRATQVPLEDQPMTDPGDPYIQTGAGWAEPAEEGSLAEYIIDKVAQAVKNEPIQSDVSIATLREWAALVDNNIPDCKLSNQIKQAALNQGIALHLIQACSSWSEVVDLMEKERKPDPMEDKPIIEKLKETALAKAIRRKEFTLARRIADTYLEGQNKTRALAEISREEKKFYNSK